MKINNIYVLAVVHFAISSGGFLLVNGGALAAQDAGVTAPVLAWLDIPLRYFLLQPLAHWVLAAFAVPWWTWPGLALTAALFALNSVLFVTAAVWLLRQARAWMSRIRAGKI